MEKVNILIIGGGVVGCAIAHALSASRQDIFLVECSPKLGMATSTRNSGVIHSGIYYPKGSFKARFCVEGNLLTKEFCKRHGVPHRNTGKLVVASRPEEASALAALKIRGEANGVEGLRLIGPAEIRAREPHVAGVAALEVPSTGILSSEALVQTYARVAVERGVNILTHARVVSLESAHERVRATLRIGENDDAEEEFVEADCVINAAGLYSDDVAAMVGNTSWKIYPVRGEYCEIRGERASVINNLVYPLPHADGLSLGVHFTKTLWGTVLLGPTATYLKEKDNYERNRLPVSEFARSAKLLLPEIDEKDLQPGYSGIRPKLVPPESHGTADFVIERDAKVPSVIHLVGIESPGLTAAPAIAQYVSKLVAETLA